MLNSRKSFCSSFDIAGILVRVVDKCLLSKCPLTYRINKSLEVGIPTAVACLDIILGGSLTDFKKGIIVLNSGDITFGIASSRFLSTHYGDVKENGLLHKLLPVRSP